MTKEELEAELVLERRARIIAQARLDEIRNILQKSSAELSPPVPRMWVSIMKTETVLERRPESTEEQLALWVEGTSRHLSTVHGGQVQCVPDSSCCYPSLQREVTERLSYMKAPVVEQVRLNEEWVRVTHDYRRKRGL